MKLVEALTSSSTNVGAFILTYTIFGGSLIDLQYNIPQNPIEAPTLPV